MINKVLVTQLIEPAFKFMQKMLFRQPFSWKKWIKLALVGWLAGEAFIGGGGGGGCNFNFPFPSQEKSHPAPLPPGFSDVWRYLLEHIIAIIIFIAIVVAILITLILVFAVLRAIFVFIFLDSLSKNQVTVRAGFSQYHRLGWRLFFFRLIFGLIVFTTLIFVIGIPVIIFIASSGGIQGLEHPHWVTIFLLIFGTILVLVPIFILAAIIHSFTNNFVVPTMYLQHIGVIPAWKRYWRTFRVHIGDTVRFLLMKFVLGLAGGVIAFVVMLIPLIPFAIIGLIIGGGIYLLLAALGLAVGKIVLLITAISLALLILFIPILFVWICLLLPLAVFFRAYTLMFLSACDPELTVLKKDEERPFREYLWQVPEVST
jgi:hypothetical protein